MCKTLTTLTIGTKQVEIKLTKHAKKRFKQRLQQHNITEWQIIGNIVMLGEKLIQYGKDEEEFIIIDNNHHFSVVCGSHEEDNKTVVYIITVIDKDNVFVKNNTSIEKV